MILWTGVLLMSIEIDSSLRAFGVDTLTPSNPSERVFLLVVCLLLVSGIFVARSAVLSRYRVPNILKLLGLFFWATQVWYTLFDIND